MISQMPQSLLDQYKLERDGCSGLAFVAVYGSVKQAMAAVAKLHGQPVAQAGAAEPGKRKKKKGKQGEMEQQGGEEAVGGAGTGVLLWARQVSGEGLHLKRWRLIVRNLPFNVSLAGAERVLDGPCLQSFVDGRLGRGTEPQRKCDACSSRGCLLPAVSSTCGSRFWA